MEFIKILSYESRNESFQERILTAEIAEDAEKKG